MKRIMSMVMILVLCTYNVIAAEENGIKNIHNDNITPFYTITEDMEFFESNGPKLFATAIPDSEMGGWKSFYAYMTINDTVQFKKSGSNKEVISKKREVYAGADNDCNGYLTLADNVMVRYESSESYKKIYLNGGDYSVITDDEVFLTRSSNSKYYLSGDNARVTGEALYVIDGATLPVFRFSVTVDFD